ncbi:hypothetical protein BDP55DRAFT_734016 [Colletotrichum godetiae]|uniref:Uncharacterized protein n=1 Tax=Colletotrichum godetiae TaxID=1209918 RepID=A0AAJ0ENJ2_9PEZI|nr:uncharacterized protein BDP55DRAFT_734016 [Colletotrichum godetiae]KAK1658636.1 hypothetical protein BDP55DRAFT_734016 [Colletotrichum godetiae]
MCVTIDQHSVRTSATSLGNNDQPTQQSKQFQPGDNIILDRFIVQDSLHNWEQVENRFSSSGELVERSVRFLDKKREAGDIYESIAELENICLKLYLCKPDKVKAKQWVGLLNLTNILVTMYHTFFRVTQHHSGDPSLRATASKVALPARLLRITTDLLKLLQRGLPATRQHMLRFVCQNYQDTAYLNEILPAFSDVWTECLARIALGGFNAALEAEAKAAWLSTSQWWYCEATNITPASGRLSCEYANLLVGDVKIMMAYIRSLCSSTPHYDGREHIKEFFKSRLETPSDPLRTEQNFVRTQGALFLRKSKYNWEFHSTSISGLFRSVAGYDVGICHACSLLEFGHASNILVRITGSLVGEKHGEKGVTNAPNEYFLRALSLVADGICVACNLGHNEAGTGYLHAILSFLAYMSKHPHAMEHFGKRLPWKKISIWLNGLVAEVPSFKAVTSHGFPDHPTQRPLPDDLALRGLVWIDRLYEYPDGWFPSRRQALGDIEFHETDQTKKQRWHRCLWLGDLVASSGQWLTLHGEVFGTLSDATSAT